MSGCLRSIHTDDKCALLWILSHSTLSVLANESSNALLLLLTVNPLHVKNSPYVQLYFSGHITQQPLRQLVLKLTPLKKEEKPSSIVSRLNSPTETILVENQVIHVASKNDWQHEVHTQKYVFYHTYLIDMQMEAICPNVLCSFIITPFQIPSFLAMVNIQNGVPKRKFRKWDYGERNERLEIDPTWTERSTTHLKTIIDFFQQVYSNRLSVGSLLMEYLEDAKDMVEYDCVQGAIGERRDLGTAEDYVNYLYGKAYGLIQYDKCRTIGVEHDDLHWGNMVTYRTPDGRFASAIIDFGISHFTSTSLTKRRRTFYNYEEKDEEKDENMPYERNSSKSSHVRLSTYISRLLSSNEKLLAWNDITRKIGSNSKRYDYVPIDLMNQIDKEMTQRYHVISRYLSSRSNGSFSSYLTKNKLDENCITLLDPSVPACVSLRSESHLKSKDDLTKHRKTPSRKSAHRFRAK